MSEWAMSDGRMSESQRASVRASHAQFNRKHNNKVTANGAVVPASSSNSDNSGGLRPSILGQARNLRPNAPVNLVKKK
jgi:hypothetical protein